jgi:hypothetical protein
MTGTGNGQSFFPGIIRRVADDASRAPPVAAVALAASLAFGAAAWPAPQDPPEGVPITGDRLDGAVLPVEPLPADVNLSALRAWEWSAGRTRRLVLEGDVSVALGGYRFTGDSAALWIDRIRSSRGLISQVVVYFDRLKDSRSQAGFRATGEVLVTGSALGEVVLEVSLLWPGPPAGPAADLLRRGEQHLARHLRALLSAPPTLSVRPRVEAAPPATGGGLPRPGAPVITPPPPPEPAVALPPSPAPAPPPLFSPEGTVRFSFERGSLRRGPDEDVATLFGPVVVEYVDRRDATRWHHLTVSAGRVVIFTDPGAFGEALSGPVDASLIRGVYAEGGVIADADDGEYVVRAPQAWYDFRTNQAILPEAVLRVRVADGVPVYARAQELRQIAANQWEANGARVSTSEFFTPHLALGAGRVTVTQSSAGDPPREVLHVDSRGNTLQVEGVPILYWPRFSGTLEDLPLRSVTVGGRSNEGVVVQTRWNPFSLAGAERPAGIDAELLLDGYTKRGPAAGLEMSYALDASLGRLDFYGLHDDGVDRTSSGLDVTPGDEWRGVALWEHQTRFDPSWTLQAQTSFISDETFITSWREDDFATRREYETGLLLRHLDGNAEFTIVGTYAPQDFLSNSWLLASRAYQVEKLPEAAYGRYGDRLFDTVTYSGETRAGRVRFVPQSGIPAQLGVPGAAFGIGDNDSIAAALALPTQYVGRFDTRHELSLPMAWGPINAVPFVVGRVTAYDDDLEGSASDSNTLRLFGAAGFRATTQVHAIYDSVESRLLGLHRLRHVIEPRFLVWYGYSDVPDGELPVYDQEVEGIGTGTVVELALRNTLQTQRGGSGRWRSVDVLAVDAGVVFTRDAVSASPTPQLFEFRPEYSQLSDHAFASFAWLPAEGFSVSGQGTWTLDDGAMARASIGTELIHTPQFSTYVEFRTIDEDGTRLLDVGWRYWLTAKYRAALWPQWDFEASEFRSVTLELIRRFPDVDLTLRITRDEIADETSIGASLGIVEF